jgi:hypothetical protein
VKKLKNQTSTPFSSKGDYSAGRFPGRVFVLIEDIVIIAQEPSSSGGVTGFMPKEDKIKNSMYYIYLNLAFLKSKLLYATIFRTVKDDNFDLTVNDSFNMINNVIAGLEVEYPDECKEVRDNIIKEIEASFASLIDEGGSLGEHLPRMRTELDSIKQRYDQIQTYIVRIMIARNMLSEFAELLSIKLHKSPIEKIVRSINFPPELKQACIGILSYFSHILSTKYPEKDVGVKIEQSGNKVIFIVETPEGEKERIEKDLSDYGLVVIGELAPEEFLHDPIEVLRLKQKLEIAALELRQTKELLYSERNHFNSRIESLETEVKNLWRLLDVQQYDKNQLISIFKDLYLHANERSKQNLEILMAAVEKGSIEKDKQAIKEIIESIKNDDKGLWTYFEELIIKGSIQGTAGNILYAFLHNIAFSIH